MRFRRPPAGDPAVPDRCSGRRSGPRSAPEKSAATAPLGPAAALSCRECGARNPLGPVFACEVCFGPLEVAYDLPTGDPEGLRARIEAGPDTMWRYAPLLPVP
ncbi:hypothetical protein ACL06G_16320, partial [Streptomyces sp. TR02-1]